MIRKQNQKADSYESAFLVAKLMFIGERTVGKLFEKSSPNPSKTFAESKMGFGIAKPRTITQKRTREPKSESFCNRKSPWRFSVSASPHAQKRKRAFFVCDDGLRGVFLLAAREEKNDVKFVHTHAVKVFAQPFLKGWWGVGQRPA